MKHDHMLTKRRVALISLTLLVTLVAAACGGGEAEPTATPAPTNRLAPTNTVAPTSPPSPTNTSEPTDTPTPTDTPEPTATPEAQAVDIDPRSVALTLDDFPPGFSIDSEGQQYTEPDYEPENINPEALEGLSAGYGVQFANEAAQEDLGNYIAITNISFVYESVKAAQAAFEARIFWPPLEEGGAERKQISGPRLGDEAFTFLVEGASEENENFVFVLYSISFRVKNVVSIVNGATLKGVGTLDTLVTLATIVEQRLNEQVTEGQ